MTKRNRGATEGIAMTKERTSKPRPADALEEKAVRELGHPQARRKGAAMVGC